MKTLIIFSILIISFKSQAAIISQLDLYQRCHSHLTGNAPKFNDPVLKDIISKRITSLEACKRILKSANLRGSNRLTNPKGISVLDTFFKIHANWFETKIFDGTAIDNSVIYEASPGGLYLTKVMFDPSLNFSDIFKGKVVFKGLRSEGIPLIAPRRNLEKADLVYDKGARVDGNLVLTSTRIPNFNFPEVGLLEGIAPAAELSITDLRDIDGKIVLNESLGGGILGDINYIMKVTKETRLRSDGAVQMPRRWGRAIYVDFLCQDVPVVNFGDDSAPYVDANSNTPFRTTAGCVSCHASMDQLAGLVRNYSTAPLDRTTGSLQAPTFVKTTTTSVYEWKSNADVNYYKKTPVGKFYYRTLDDKLINSQLRDMDALGNLLGQLNDTYMCAASRYLEHFTGVKFPITRVAVDTLHPYSKAIRSLASDLKTSQSSIQLVEKILSSDIYNDSKFLIGE